MKPYPREEQTSPLALRVIPPAQSNEPELIVMATAMQGLVLDERHPIALEIVGTAQHRSFLVRATTPAALAHVKTQLLARYPQAECVPLAPEEDPFQLHAGEAVSALELRAGTAPYLPLQTWDARTLAQEGTNPLLGVLAALDALPEGMRVISQLALLPAPPGWSQPHQRKAVEHALAPERARSQAQGVARGSAPSTPMLVLLSLLLGGLLLSPQYQDQIPPWLGPALLSLARGHLPTLSPLQQAQLYGGLGILLGGLFALLAILRWLRRFFAPPVYDMKLVGQKTARMAYRVRLRLYAIGPTAPPLHLSPLVSRSSLHHLRRLRQECWCFVTPAHSDKKDISKCLRRARRLGQMSTLLIRRLTGEMGQWMGTKLWQSPRTSHAFHQQRTLFLSRLVAAYRQYHLAAGDYFVPKKVSGAEARRCLCLPPQAGLTSWSGCWRGLRHSRHIISVDSLAHLWHLPPAHLLPELAQVESRRTRTFLLPPLLAEAAQGRPIIGYSDHAGHHLPFGFPPTCLDKHLLIGGKSGEGKSTCMEHLAREAMQQGGLIVIDPHGDLVEHLLRLVPSHRCDDVVLIDLADPDAAVGLNPLDVTMGRGRDKAVSDLLKTLSHIWVSSWGSRMEIAFEYALRTLYEANKQRCLLNAHTGPHGQYTLLDVMQLLTDESFCHSLLEMVEDEDPFLLRWWYLYYDPLSLTMQRDRVDPVLSKVAKFESQIARRIVGQAQSTINFMDCLQQEKIVLVKLAKGIIGEDVARLLGATLLGLLQITLEEQGAKAETERKRLPIMIDEFQVLKGVDWAALAELRKYGAAFYLATQSLEYLREINEQLLPTVLANVKQLIIFHVSARDAMTLHKELDVEPEDLLHLDSYTCYVKLTSGGRRQPTFSLRLVLPPPGDEERARQIRSLCRQRYTRPASLIDETLKHAMIRALQAQPRPSSRQRRPGVAAASGQESSSPSARESTGQEQGTAGLANHSRRLRARQEGGYRGRRAQVKWEKEEQQAPQRSPQQSSPARYTQPMNWHETVGHSGTSGKQHDDRSRVTQGQDTLTDAGESQEQKTQEAAQQVDAAQATGGKDEDK